MRGRNLLNIFKALDLFSKPEGITIKELATHLGISRRSVYRLLTVMEELEFPIFDDTIPLEKEKRWKLVESYVLKLPNLRLPKVSFTLSEVLSLYLLKGEENLFQGTEIEEHIKSAYDKIGLFISTDKVSQLQGIKALFIPSSKFTKDYSGKEGIIEKLTDAMLQRKTCRVKYHSFSDDQIKDFKIDPLHFFESSGGLYLFVNATAYNEIRTLAVERIKNVSLTSASFRYPTHFNPETMLESAFDLVFDEPIEVRIWFSAGQARYIRERKWSKTQKIEDQQDGSIILSMKTSGWWDVKKWVLSYGTEARVLEPERLWKEVIEALKATFKSYEQLR